MLNEMCCKGEVAAKHTQAYTQSKNADSTENSHKTAENKQNRKTAPDHYWISMLHSPHICFSASQDNTEKWAYRKGLVARKQAQKTDTELALCPKTVSNGEKHIMFVMGTAQLLEFIQVLKAKIYKGIQPRRQLFKDTKQRLKETFLYHNKNFKGVLTPKFRC